MKSKLRSPAKYHGGKGRLARRIIALMPPTSAFAEHYAGAMSVGLNLEPMPHHVANDVDPDLMHFWRTLQEAGSDFLGSIRALDYSEETFRWAREVNARGEAEPAGRRALAFLVMKRMSRGGLGTDFARCGTIADGSPRLRGGRPDNVNAWATWVDGELPRVVRRLASIRLTCRDALGSIREADAEYGPDVVHYLDPTYWPATRTHRDAYRFEMTEDDHRAMLAAIREVKGSAATDDRLTTPS